MGEFFAFRRVLAGAMLAGFVFGLAQQVRGAHYLSHTLWTAWLCWTVAAGVDAAVNQLIARKRLPAPAPARGFSAPGPLTPAK